MARGNLTEGFLTKNEYLPEDELMMSNFITMADNDKKHDLILYYLDNVSTAGSGLKDLSENDEPTDIWKQISKKLKERLRKYLVVK